MNDERKHGFENEGSGKPEQGTANTGGTGFGTGIDNSATGADFGAKTRGEETDIELWRKIARIRAKSNAKDGKRATKDGNEPAGNREDEAGISDSTTGNIGKTVGKLAGDEGKTGRTKTVSELEDKTSELVVKKWQEVRDKINLQKPAEEISVITDVMQAKPAQVKQTILAIHKMAAVLFGPEVEITSEQAEQLAKAWCNVCKEFNLVFTGKTAALIGFIGTAALVEGPIVYRIIFKTRKIKEEKKLEFRIPGEIENSS
ncbi:MAG: hypothetical protein QXF82_00840 [Nitrososphaeria archaeon]